MACEKKHKTNLSKADQNALCIKTAVKIHEVFRNLAMECEVLDACGDVLTEVILTVLLRFVEEHIKLHASVDKTIEAEDILMTFIKMLCKKFEMHLEEKPIHKAPQTTQ